MMLEAKVLLPSDKDVLTAFERHRLETSHSDSMEAEIQSWSARWRGEALDHYLPLGWSFGAWSGEELAGYLLGQPFLFLRGLTQTLWVEHLAYDSQDAAGLLVDTVHKWARDKHLQCVLFESSPDTAFILSEWKQARVLDERLIELKSARFQ